MKVVKEVMQVEHATIDAGGKLLDAAQRMVSLDVETLFVVDGDQLIGTIGMRDLFTTPVPAHYGGNMHFGRQSDELVHTWEGTPLAYLMNERVITITEEAPLMRAAELMVNTGKHPLAVVREGRIVGTISRADVVRGLLDDQGLLPRHRS